jgi:hypothetical protein
VCIGKKFKENNMAKRWRIHLSSHKMLAFLFFSYLTTIVKLRISNLGEGGYINRGRWGQEAVGRMLGHIGEVW